MDDVNKSGPSQAVQLLSKDPVTEGFDFAAGETWIYPTNYPIREYQFNIIQKALLKNTLVSLPTGLGKTFIAAVVMYNFYRWYPEGKMIFMAPTKPLVKQQVDACYNIMAIPLEVTAELTGAKQSTARADIWTDKRVFFITPQVLQNDLNKIEQLGSKIKCLVFDEAHKARGNYAYCEVIQRLVSQEHKNFRVLALSATPGSSVNDVLEVVKNLLISHLEFRTEESIDVKPYAFQRTLETIVVPLSEKLVEVREQYLKILEYYTKSLKNYNIIQGNCGSLTKGKIFILLKDFQQKNKGTRSAHYAEITRSLNICVTLYHAFELLIRHGLRNFASFFEEHMEKPLLRGNHHLRAIVEDVRNFLGPIPDIEKLPDGTYPEVPTDLKFGHPKYYKLRDVLMEHFRTAEKNTRVIVFFEYRESVMEAHLLLLQSRPLIQPRIFLGQGSGITQKLQIGVVKAFREGKCNVLLSTSIGEEGLDVGEVDLIICFDISTKSPIRMVQRMGRTGRKRAGKVLVLVTEGKEQQTLKDCLIQKNNISTFVLGSKQLSNGMYPDSPRLVPDHITPRCEKIFITVKKRSLVLKKNGSIKDMLSSISSGSSELVFSQELPLSNKPERIKTGQMLFHRGEISNVTITEKNIFSKHIEKQRNLQKSYKIGHSKHSEILVNLLQLSDSKRFNLPTQVQNTQATKKVLKQGDIRNMFFTTRSQDHFEIPKVNMNIDLPTQEIIKNLEKSDDSENCIEEFAGSTELFGQISNFLFLKTSDTEERCRHCPNNFSCEKFKITLNETDFLNNNWVPSDKIFEEITAEEIVSFTKTLDPVSEESILMEEDSLFDNTHFTQLMEETGRNKNEKSFKYQAPDSLCELLNKFGDSIIEKPYLSQECTIKTSVTNKTNSISERLLPAEELFNFFKITNLIDIFDCRDMSSYSQETLVYSPDIASNVRENNIILHDQTPESSDIESSIIEENESPVLSSENRLKMLRKKVLQRSKRYNIQIDLFNTSSQNNLERSKNQDESTHNNDHVKNIDIEDICDISSFFGSKHKDISHNDDANLIPNKEETCKKENQTAIIPLKKENQTAIIPLNELVDESLFDLLTPPINKNEESGDLSQSNSSNKNQYSDDMFDDSILGMLTQPNLYNRKDTHSEKNTDGLCKNNTLENNTFQGSPTNKSTQLTKTKLESGSIKKQQTTIDILDSTTQAVTQTFKNENVLKNFIDDSFLNLLSQSDTRSVNNHESCKSSDVELVKIKEKNGKILVQNESQLCKTDLLLQKTEFNKETSNGQNLWFESTPIKKNISAMSAKENKNVSLKNVKSNTDDTRSSSDEWFEDTQLPNSSNNKVVKKIQKTSEQTIKKETNCKVNKSNDVQKNQNKLDKETVENNSFIDLTLDSPPKSTPKTSRNLTQLGITQMLSYINKTQSNESSQMKNIRNQFGSQTTQIENVVRYSPASPKAFFTQVSREPLMISTQKKMGNSSSSTNGSENKLHNDSKKNDFTDSSTENSAFKLGPFTNNDLASSQKENEINNPNSSSSGNNLNESSFLTTGWKNKARKNLLSTRRKVLDDTDDDYDPPKKTALKPKLDPYEFITQRVKPSQTLSKIQTKLDATIEITSSDEEFEARPKKSLVFLKPKNVSITKFKDSRKKKKTKKANPFLDLEAELSEEDNVFVSSDEDDKNSECFDLSFVVPNATQNLDTQMHAHYLQSVRSPTARGKFKIPERPTHNISNVFSQPVNYAEENTYLEDSFCVDAEESQIQQEHELSELEILEMKLKNKKKRKKSAENPSVSKNKRRRIILSDSDSD